MLHPPLISHTSRRYAIAVRGIVQGVGFRPFVYRLARKHDLSGFVANTTEGVAIEVEGKPQAVAAFFRDLKDDAPPLAAITGIRSCHLAPLNETEFSIHPSIDRGRARPVIPPDAAICADCRRELLDPENRRHLYPFINCINCGPRHTITEHIPYDRPHTSMRHFTMCADCQAEYDDPASRRFHAQPNACPACGPVLGLYSRDSALLDQGPAAVDRTRVLLTEGKIAAIKGIGGFHLACDATNEAAVRRLRRRKGRAEKPFAVMVRDLAAAARICILNEDEKNSLASCAAPIVLATKRADHGLAASVAPHSDCFGVMLAYAPLHHLLFGGAVTVLVMTSANYSDEPICIDNQDAFTRLSELADCFLTHNRDIIMRSDDSIVRHAAGRMRAVRRSRGIAPRPVILRRGGPAVLGVGGELKSTVCLLKGREALVSQHLGDLQGLDSYDFFRQTIVHMERVSETRPELIVHDLHPGYLSVRWAAEQQEAPTLGVQHHHAHLVACLAENRIAGPAIGLIMDGTGYGSDGTIWGGEVLVGDCREYSRYAHFEPMPLPGGDAAVKAPWRTALAYVYQAFNGTVPDLPFLAQHDVDGMVEMVHKKINSPMTSSCGRLFDAIAALAGGRQVVSYEAQAAVEFMQQGKQLGAVPYAFALSAQDGVRIMSVSVIIRAVVQAIQQGEPLPSISQRFHRTLVELFLAVSRQARHDTGIRTVVLSGGVFQNPILLHGAMHALAGAGFDVFAHAELPSNDGSLSLGQAVIGREFLRKACAEKGA